MGCAGSFPLCHTQDPRNSIYRGGNCRLGRSSPGETGGRDRPDHWVLTAMVRSRPRPHLPLAGQGVQQRHCPHGHWTHDDTLRPKEKQLPLISGLSLHLLTYFLRQIHIPFLNRLPDYVFTLHLSPPCQSTHQAYYENTRPARRQQPIRLGKGTL